MLKNYFITTLLFWCFIPFLSTVNGQNLPASADLPENDHKLRVAIIPDTQGDDEEMGVAQKEITAIKDHLLNEMGGVDMVLHVGDVTNAKVAGVPGDEQEPKIKAELELFNSLFTEPLAQQGIPFYPIVGNHDYRKRTPWTEVFSYLFDGSDPNGAYVDPETVPGGSASSPNADNFSYVVKHPESNTYFVLLDAFNGGYYYEWLEAKYKEIRNESPDARIFSIQHMNLFSLTVHAPLDNMRDAKANDTPEKFRQITEKYNIEGWFSGHNHYYHRAMHVDGNNNPLSFDYVVGAASFKVYDNFTRHPLDEYRTQKTLVNKWADGRFKANYLLMDVFEKFVVIKTYYSDEYFDGSFSDFRLTDEYIYSTNGKQTLVKKQESFATIADTANGEGFEGTQLAILQGTNNDARTFVTKEDGQEQKNPYYLNVTTGWLPANEWHTGKSDSLISDVLVLRGMSYMKGSRYTFPYTIKLSYNDALLSAQEELNLSLVGFLDYNLEDSNSGDWYNATYGVKDPNDMIKKTIGAPFEEAVVGDFGVDTVNNYVWARLDCQGDFAVGYSHKELLNPKLYKNNTIDLGDKWKYTIDTVSSIDNWNQRGFDDSGWLLGQAPMGYGDDEGLNTTIEPADRIFMRKTFQLINPAVIHDVEFAVDYDDGYVLYLNGEEIDRKNVDDNPVTFTTFASEAINNQGELTTYDLTERAKPHLVKGENVLAIAVLNANSTSSDLSIYPELYLYSKYEPLPEESDFYQIDDCDSKSDWNSSATLMVDDSEQRQGLACLTYEGSGTDEFSKLFTPAHNVNVKLEGAKLQFWYYVSDTSKLTENNQVELGSGGQADSDEYNWSLSALEPGWNFISLNFADANESGGTPDLSAINWFRIYQEKTGSVKALLDDIRVTGEMLETTVHNEQKFLTAQLLVYPNPAKKGVFALKSEAFAADAEVLVEIINLRGEVLIKKQLKVAENLIVDTRNTIPSGMYILRVKSKNIDVAKKLFME